MGTDKVLDESEDIIDRKVQKWVERNGYPAYCAYCIFTDCPQCMTCYGGEPIEMPCMSCDAEDFLDMDAIREHIADGQLAVELA